MLLKNFPSSLWKLENIFPPYQKACFRFVFLFALLPYSNAFCCMVGYGEGCFALIGFVVISTGL